MSSDSPLELKKELLDDFYAECDELLTSIRAELTRLEATVDGRDPDPGTIEALFRHLHSLKGISAIVGLRPAEQLAHGAEDLLRALSKKTVRLSPVILEALQVATQRLGQIVSGHRRRKALPDIGEILKQLRQLVPARTKPPMESAAVSEASPEVKADPLEAARQQGLQLYSVSFSPSANLDARGVNVNAVRERLKAIGQIVRATPSVREGSIVFEFVVGVRETPADFAPWENDGLHFEAIPASAPDGETARTAQSRDAEDAESLSLTPSHIVRVDLARLDELMRITGEMVIHRSRLEERINQEKSGPGLKEVNLALARSLRELREAISRVRMVPIAEIFTRMPFVVRDLVRNSEKKVRVSLEGHQTEVDKYLVERLKEPLLHLVRNAFAHGIESPAERTAAGKPPEATILLRARSAGEALVIQIRDDGRGVDLVALAARASALGLKVPESLDAGSALRILCTPGFSTRDEADLAAGRGVGMAVVANTVRELGGTLALDSTLGLGTEFTLRLPLTLSIAEAIIVSVGQETCAVPQSAVDEIIQPSAGEARLIQGTTVIPYRGSLLPIIRLRTMFKLPDTPGGTLTVLVVSSERGAIGLVVDRVRAQREIVIRPLADRLLRVPGISGATELGDGRPILILDPVAITQGVVRPPSDSPVDANLPEARVS
ncbi:MAG: chemotaxis protein CheA [Opitutaceae bacterium]